MSDYEEDYGDEEIDYNPDEEILPEENEGFNLEDNFIEAEHSNDPIEAYKMIIDLEISNSSDHKWSYKSYEKLCQLYIKKLDFPEVKKSLDKLFELYPKIDYSDKQETIRDISFALTEVKDLEFEKKVFTEILEQLKDKELDLPYMDTGLQWGRVLFAVNEYNVLKTLLPELMDYLNRLPEDDEIYKTIKLELLVMQMQLLKVENKLNEIKPLYLEAIRYIKDSIFYDKKLSGIINEEGGKIDLRQQEYEKALQKFKLAFHNYQESGSNQAVSVLKYAFLTSLITRDQSIIVSPEEAKLYNDKNLNAIVKLFLAYENKDIKEIIKIWDEEIVKKEKDPFIVENLNEIFYNIRLNYIFQKLSCYHICKFDTLMKELSMSKDDLVPMLFQICKISTEIKFKINLVEDYIELDKKIVDSDYGDLVKNYNSWLSLFK